MATVNIANYDPGDIGFNVQTGSIMTSVLLVSGVITPVDDVVWKEISSNNSLAKFLLREKKLEVVKTKKGDVPLNHKELVDLTLTPDLLREEEEGNFFTAKVKSTAETTIETAPIEPSDQKQKKTRKPRKSTKK